MLYLIAVDLPESDAAAVRLLSDAALVLTGTDRRNLDRARETLATWRESGAAVVGYCHDPEQMQEAINLMEAAGATVQVEEGDSGAHVPDGEVSADVVPEAEDGDEPFRPEFTASQIVMVMLTICNGDLDRTSTAINTLASVIADETWAEAVAAFRVTFGGGSDA